MARDDALTWDGDDDPTLQVAAGRDGTSAAGPALPGGYTAVGRGSDTVGRIEDDGRVTMPTDRAPASNAALIALGVLGGVYLLYIVGWVIGGLRLQGAAQYLVFDVMFTGSFWLAVLAPALWFGTALLLARRARPWVRYTALAGGVLLLVPWPFILVGAVGQ